MNLKRLLVTFLTSICLYVIFGTILIIYVAYIPWPPIPWVMIVTYCLIPIISAFGFCFFIHRSVFHFDRRNMTSKASICRLIIRFLTVFCFLLIGYAVYKNHGLPIFVLDMLRKLGEFGDIVAWIIPNFNFYLVNSIFPIVFAIVEYLFVATNTYSADS